jgi:hypothetical protein
MISQKRKFVIDDITKKRISKLEWKKDVQKPETKAEVFAVNVIYSNDWIKDKYERFTLEEKEAAHRFCQIILNSLAGQDYDRFLEKVLPAMNAPTRRNIEDVHNVIISNAVDKLTKDKNRFPARCEIVAETGYSHKTIDDTIRNYPESAICNGRKGELVLMREKMIAMCFQYGVRGDMKAARLFLEATDKRVERSVTINGRNNFIQINGYAITTNEIKTLPIEMQMQMKEIVQLLTVNKHLTLIDGKE